MSQKTEVDVMVFFLVDGEKRRNADNWVLIHNQTDQRVYILSLNPAHGQLEESEDNCQENLKDEEYIQTPSTHKNHVSTTGVDSILIFLEECLCAGAVAGASLAVDVDGEAEVNWLIATVRRRRPSAVVGRSLRGS